MKIISLLFALMIFGLTGCTFLNDFADSGAMDDVMEEVIKACKKSGSRCY